MKTLLYYFLAIVCQIFFLKTFFPLPQTGRSTVIKRPDYLEDIKLNRTNASLVDRIIFIVVDALRLDFVTGEYTPFLFQTAQTDGCFFEMHVESPTVTLPRIKSLTTGRVPQFIDVLLNLGSPATVDDSFLHQAVKQGKKVVFYGDDTWLKIYPKLFTRSEGVSSFFVSDFTEVKPDDLIKNDYLNLKFF